MADPTTAPQPGAEQGNAPEQVTVTDEHSAADAILRAGLLGDIGDADTPPAPQHSAHEAEDGPRESEATGEEEGQSEPEPATAAAIEPPKSWSDEDKALFAKLPPDAQAVIARREGERDKAFNQRTEEIADTRKAIEAERTAFQSQTAQYAENLQKLAALAVPDMAEYAKLQDLAWVNQNPAEAVALRTKMEIAQGRFAAIQQEMAKTREAQLAEHNKRLGERLAEEARKLPTIDPAFADKEKGGKLLGEIRADLTNRGFNETEIGGVSDHRLVGIALDAMRWRQHQATVKAAQAKTAPQPAPRVQRPGPAQDAGEAASRAVRDIAGQFAKTGNVRDAARLLEHIF